MSVVLWEIFNLKKWFVSVDLLTSFFKYILFVYILVFHAYFCSLLSFICRPRKKLPMNCFCLMFSWINTHLVFAVFIACCDRWQTGWCRYWPVTLGSVCARHTGVLTDLLWREGPSVLDILVLLLNFWSLGSHVGISVSLQGKLQALVYDILPSATAVFSYAWTGSRKLSANE